MHQYLRPYHLYIFLLVTMITLSFSLSAAQTDESAASHQNLSKQINTLLKEGRHPEALPLIQQYDQQYPGNPNILYNLACVENAVGNSAAALAALEKAAKAGFDDFHRAENDPDLKSLAGEPGYQALVLEHELAMSAQSAALGFSATRDEWSPYRLLSPQVSTPGETTPEITMRVKWQHIGLAIEMTGPLLENPSQANLAPWMGGDAVFVTIAMVNDASSWETDNTFHFIFGKENGQPTGAIYLSTQNQWQQVEELGPKISKNGENNSFIYSLTIPWAILDPFHPLIDTTMGLNVCMRQVTTTGSREYSLRQDPSSFHPKQPWHRYAAMSFYNPDTCEAQLQGRLSHSIAGNKPLALELKIITPNSGPGSLTIDFLDNQDFSVLGETEMNIALDLEKGANSFSWPVDFSSLRTGPYLVRTSVDFPGGESLTWETPILHLQPGWIETVGGYLENIPPGEVATTKLTMDILNKAIPELKPRRNPQALGKTLRDLLGMADRASRLGSILPPTGPFVLAYAGPDDKQQVCSVFFPPGYRDAAELLPILVLNNYRGFEFRMAERMDRFYEYWANAPKPDQRSADTVPVYIFPSLDASVSSIGQDGVEDAAHTARWALDFFGVPEIAVAGIDGSLGDALGLVYAEDIPTAAMLLVAGRDVRIWPNAQPEFLAGKLPAPAGNLPVKWLDFPYETEKLGQAPDILEAMQKNNWNIVTMKTVKGALGITQATDRIILWAENLR